MYNPFALKDKTILVTGASSGIGRAIAIECSKMGAKVIITGRNVKRLNETFLTLENGEHQQLTTDFATDAGIDELVSKLPKLDGCVNNAGVAHPLLLQQIERSDITEIFDLNAFAPFILIQKLLQNKKLNKKASLVFTSSISGIYCSSVGGALYSASKGALNGFMKGAALDLAGRGIRVNSVNPGLIDTNIFSEGTITAEQLQEEISHYPLRRAGKPEEVAYAVIYLLSDASEWVTGTNIKIDGGFTLL